MARRLWYDKPAENWNEALPLGNGRLGAMVFGGINEENICLNEDTLWSGYPRYYGKPMAKEAFEKARLLTIEKKYDEAEEVIEKGFTNLWNQKYLPVGNIYIHFETKGTVSDYKRELDLGTAIQTVCYKDVEAEYTRRCFVSHPDESIVYYVETNRKGGVNCSISMKPAMSAETGFIDNGITFSGNAPVFNYIMQRKKDPDLMEYGVTPETKGMGYYACLQVKVINGKVYKNNSELVINNADKLMVIVDIRTSYNGCNKHPFIEGRAYRAPCRKNVERVIGCSFDYLLKRHIEDYSSLYNLVSFSLGETEGDSIPTDQRLQKHYEGMEDNDLYALFFDYARYLTIAASRSGTSPMNLQGIWNDEINAPWNCAYTLNINLEMNYWPTLELNLGSCHEPLQHFVEELFENGCKASKEYLGIDGFMVNHNSDIWGIVTPMGAGNPGVASFACWPMGAVWLCRNLLDYYDYYRDKRYLKRIWPMLISAAKLCIGLLHTNEKKQFIISPATSPENSFVTSNGKASISQYSAMNQALAADLFDSIVSLAAEIGKEQDELVIKIRKILQELAPICLNEDGTIREWDEGLRAVDIKHRHISQLYALHPGHWIDVNRDTELAKGCKKTLIEKGDDTTGWAMGWRINQWARLKDGNHALKLLNRQLKPVDIHAGVGQSGGTYPNLFDAHPPFQIDGNFGACAGILEMLVQSQHGYIELLPALPNEWANGSINGLRVRGAYILDMTWHNKQLSKATFTAENKGTLCLANGKVYRHDAGQTITIFGNDY